MKIFLFAIFSFYFCHITISQEVSYIKSSKDYIWGEGKGATIKQADGEALAQIASQISLQVESKFEQTIKQTETNSKFDFKQQVNSIVNTYSNVSLSNVQRSIISNEPEAVVFRYILKSDVFKIFEQRKNKIIQFTDEAVKSTSHDAIADALKYYYWALMLLRSHPDANEISYKTIEGQTKLLAIWLPAQINATFALLRMNVSKIEKNGNDNTINLFITHNNRPVSNFDFSYWNGQDWAEIVSAKDGVGSIELPQIQTAKDISIKAEYIFDTEARSDRELEEVMKIVPSIPFKNSYFKVALAETTNEQKVAVNTPSTTNSTEVYSTNMSNAPITNSIAKAAIVNQPNAIDTTKLANIKTLTETKPQQDVINKILTAIKQKNYESVKPLFSSEGYAVFNALINYGKATVIGIPTIKYYTLNNIVSARSVKFKFTFTNNNKSFIEDVVFHFTPDGLVDNLTFSLDNNTVQGIASKTAWPEVDRLTIINFLEQFKTSYALKRLDYISSIFADDALIITGKQIRTETKLNDGQISSLPQIKYSKQTKAEYIKNLKLAFTSKEYINLKFEESSVEQGGANGKTYGINVAQRYFSSNYGDFGYLFLLVNLENPALPQIHVRTWQPTKDAKGKVWTMGDF